jgi:hypothetical protein
MCRFAHMLNSLEGLIWGRSVMLELVGIMTGTHADGQPSALVSRMSPTWWASLPRPVRA